MSMDLKTCLWQYDELGPALTSVARVLGLPIHADRSTSNHLLNKPACEAELEAWLGAATSRLGIEAEPANILYKDIESFLHSSMPAVLEYHASQNSGYLVLFRKQWRKIILLKPDHTTYNTSVHELKTALCHNQLEPVRQELKMILDSAGITTAKQDKNLDALLRERFKTVNVGKGWILRANPGSDFWQQIRQEGALPLLSGFVVFHATMYGLMLIFWGMLGNAAINKITDWQVLVMLAALILMLFPPRLLAPWLFGSLAIRVSERLKRRLLYGALQLEPEEIRHQGTGQFLGRVLETETIETSAQSGSSNIFMGLIQLSLTIPYLIWGAGGWFHIILLLSWVALTFLLTRQYYHARTKWTQARLKLTHDLVEQMVGYRTRLAQQPRGEWHVEEEKLLDEYSQLSAHMDRLMIWIKVFVPRGWTLAGLLTLIPALLMPGTLPKIALEIAGVVFANLSFQQIGDGITQMTGAWVSWDQVRLMFDAAARPTQVARSKNAAEKAVSNQSQALLKVEGLGFRYKNRDEATLKNCDFSINAGERVLLLGPSGSGKTSLAALLAGLRTPQSGMLRLDGVAQTDMEMKTWRKRVIIVPQFHENHIFTESFAFNLLMGRRWPPTADDLCDAREICKGLGLADLLEQMPGGMFQIVGETGWQLSHGEKSRVYIARALLQGADVIILDESFSALDAGNLRQSLECVLERANTLIVIAHP